MSNVSEIVNGVRQAKIALGDLVVKIPLNKNSGAYNTSTGKVTLDPTSTPTIEIAITAYEADEIDGANIREDDLKGFVFDTNQSIDTDDTLVYGGITYTIKTILPIMAGNTLVGLQVHLTR